VHSLDAWLTHADSAALGYVGPALWDGDDQALIPQNLHSSPLFAVSRATPNSCMRSFSPMSGAAAEREPALPARYPYTCGREVEMPEARLPTDR
jgi:hypothetical protein